MADPIYTLNVSKLIEKVTNDRFPQGPISGKKKLQASLGIYLKDGAARARALRTVDFQVIVPIPSD